MGPLKNPMDKNLESPRLVEKYKGKEMSPLSGVFKATHYSEPMPKEHTECVLATQHAPARLSDAIRNLSMTTMDGLLLPSIVTTHIKRQYDA